MSIQKKWVQNRLSHFDLDHCHAGTTKRWGTGPVKPTSGCTQQFLFTAANQKPTPYANRELKSGCGRNARETAQETLSHHWFFEGWITHWLPQRGSLPHNLHAHKKKCGSEHKGDVPFFVTARVIFFTPAPALHQKPDFHSKVGPGDSGESDALKISALASLSPSELRCF